MSGPCFLCCDVLSIGSGIFAVGQFPLSIAAILGRRFSFHQEDQLSSLPELSNAEVHSPCLSIRNSSVGVYARPDWLVELISLSISEQTSSNTC